MNHSRTKEPDFTEISRKHPLPSDDLRPALELPPIRHTPSPTKRPRSPDLPRAEPEPELDPPAPFYGQQHHHCLPPAGYPPPPHAYAQPTYYYLHDRAPHYSEPPRDHRLSYGAYHHHTVHHGQPYCRPHHIATHSRAVPPAPPSTVRGAQHYQFQQQSPCQILPEAAPTASTLRQPPSVQSGYHQYPNHPPPPSNEHETRQQPKIRKTNEAAPVIHTNQNRFAKASNTNYWDQSQTSAEREGQNYELDDRKPAAAQEECTTLNRVPTQHTTQNAPNLEHIIGGYLEHLKPSRRRSWADQSFIL